MVFFLRCLFLLCISTELLSQSNDTITVADPTIFAHGGEFYLYGTGGKGNAGGFFVYVSDDLKSWHLSDKNNGYALKKGDAFGDKGFWAPQVFQYNGKFYMAYTANEQIAIAQSDSPIGPFTQLRKDSLASTMKQIDPFVFFDDDGKKYLYHVRLTNGNRIFVAEMVDDLSAIKPETARECVSAENGWENTAKVEWPVTEGPTVVKINGVYYLFYSANDFRNPDYAVGYATSNHPLGPWKKHEQNPIIVRQMLGFHGTGHGDVFKRGKNWYYVFHTHQSNTRVAPRKTALVKVTYQRKTKTWKIDPSTVTFLQLKP